jgi:hypothetical protein
MHVLKCYVMAHDFETLDPPPPPHKKQFPYAFLTSPDGPLLMAFISPLVHCFFYTKSFIKLCQW